MVELTWVGQCTVLLEAWKEAAVDLRTQPFRALNESAGKVP